MALIPSFKARKGDSLQTRLVHAVTRYDRQQAQRKGYNCYALGQYLAAIECVTEMAKWPDTNLRLALIAHFNGRLLDVVLKACDLPKSTREEQH